MAEELPRCDRCRYWVKPADSAFASGIDREFGRCEQTPHSEEVGAWDWDDGDGQWKLDPKFADRTAIARDGSGYFACLETKAEHFCAMFKAHETEAV